MWTLPFLLYLAGATLARLADEGVRVALVLLGENPRRDAGPIVRRPRKRRPGPPHVSCGLNQGSWPMRLNHLDLPVPDGEAACAPPVTSGWGRCSLTSSA